MPAQTTLPIEQYRPEDLVFVSKTNALVTDSLLVAKYFGKQHKNVLQEISTLDCSQKFTKLNFQLCHKNNELQNSKLRPFYQMTKDGFIFLVMGFTGKKAAIIKEAYINAF
ncbi:TPA: Rha family transcriptional regulator [Vibrio alginolyticus]|nr:MULTISPECIES: Rha family transcriptional regulator [Vibrio]MCS0136027.1 Rha family transcriptional regulator [Vibrio alginolyticus]MDW1549197.1 Rha family transcriptional regulator [Vibrio sp. YT-18]